MRASIMRRSDDIAWSQVRMGIFIVVALLLFAAGVLLMGNKTKMFVSKGKLSLIMTDVAGLKVGAPVWLAGVDVGVVTSIRFERPDQANEVEITLEVDQGSLRKIGKDSTITIKTRGLMGEKYVDITPSRHLVTVPETRVYGTNVPKLDDVMQKAAVAFDHLNDTMEKVTNGQGSVGKMIADPRLYENLTKLSSELNRFISTANSGEGTIGKLNNSPELYDRMLSTLAHADATLNDLEQADGTLNKLIYDKSLYEKLVALADKSGQAANDMLELNRKLTSKDSSIGKLLADREFYDKGIALIDRADKSVKAYQDAADRVNRGEGTAGKLITDQALYDKMNKAVDDLDLLLKDIQSHPKRYLKFSVF
jgi:phospholipid/cholesterol/gamma-HCH transport system substrate-binding protein